MFLHGGHVPFCYLQKCRFVLWQVHAKRFANFNFLPIINSEHINGMYYGFKSRCLLISSTSIFTCFWDDLLEDINQNGKSNNVVMRLKEGFANKAWGLRQEENVKKIHIVSNVSMKALFFIWVVFWRWIDRLLHAPYLVRHYSYFFLLFLCPLLPANRESLSANSDRTVIQKCRDIPSFLELIS